MRIEITDHVADVRMVRADKHNGLDWAMFVSLNEAIDELRRVDGHAQRLGIATDLPASLGDDRQRRGDLVRHQGIQVELVGEAGGQAPRHLWAVAADDDRQPRRAGDPWARGSRR